jgi:hypothetical protein
LSVNAEASITFGYDQSFARATSLNGKPIPRYHGVTVSVADALSIWTPFKVVTAVSVSWPVQAIVMGKLKFCEEPGVTVIGTEPPWFSHGPLRV